MTTQKRAYKLQEFVAHASSVNCLKIGRKSSRVLVTGGEDHKVNLWAIGKPNALLSLSGHSSGIDSVGFDSSEVLVAAGAASGTIKLWDLEEAKILRTLTGHRSNCISLDFHPFGEFFASGSLDTNLKIWDIRRKGCIHTYKGHTRGVNAIRFTPDGRWVVSGGEDNIVKLWDLTAGKLLHEFKSHEGQIQCIDFHPHEFLLATGSADKTVKFWDLETFELIGSSGPETTGVSSITFNPDGRTLLCGLHESLKVLSWEPIRSHDSVDVGWSRLSDLSIHDGKLLGCSYNQSCVGVWVVDISRIEPYAVGNNVSQFRSHQDSKSNLSANVPILTESNAKVSTGRISTSRNPEPVDKEIKSFGRLSVSQNSDHVPKEPKSFPSTGSAPGTPQRTNPNIAPKTSSVPVVSNTVSTAAKRSTSKVHSSTTILNKSDVVPVIVPRNNGRSDQEVESKRGVIGRTMPLSLQAKSTEFQKFSVNRDEEKPVASVTPENVDANTSELGGMPSRSTLTAVKNSTAVRNPAAGIPGAGAIVRDERCTVSAPIGWNPAAEPLSTHHRDNYETSEHKGIRNVSSLEGPKRGRTRSFVTNWEKRDRYKYYDAPVSGDLSTAIPDSSFPPNARRHLSPGKESVSTSDEDIIFDTLEQHDDFLGSMRSRLSKLQIVRKCWERQDVRGSISAMEKMDDHAVIADVISFLTEKPDIVTLDILTLLLPLLSRLLESNIDRHKDLSLGLLLKLVRVFGAVIYSTVSASPSVGVDIEAEQRFERCNLCIVEFEKVKRCLPKLTRRGGSTAKSAQELNLSFQQLSRA